jgi:hypothetical protein
MSHFALPPAVRLTLETSDGLCHSVEVPVYGRSELPTAIHLGSTGLLDWARAAGHITAEQS